MQNKIVRLLFFMLVFLLLLQVFGGGQAPVSTTDEVVISSKSKITIGKAVAMGIENRSAETIVVPNVCPKNPLSVENYKNGEWVKKEASLTDVTLCKDQKEITVPPKGKAQVVLDLWAKDLFGQIGQYRVSYKTLLAGKEKTYVHEFEIVPPTFLQKLWQEALYLPILNTLFFIIATVPGHNLGWAILLLTVLIKLILLVPNQKALKSQKALQVIQPQLEALKVQYKDSPQKLAEETMKIWKDHKVNPMGSCLPMLIQFPILIALFYVVKGGLSVDPQLLYGSLKGFDPKMVSTIFFGLDLTKVNAIFLPIIIGLLQFAQIRLSFAKAKPAAQSQAALMNKMMQYVLPVMIGVFSAGLPAAVGFYWGVSTLFAIGQQIVVNRSKT
jgi:YidC/Oxa1 family membrane protein insertase